MAKLLTTQHQRKKIAAELLCFSLPHMSYAYLDAKAGLPHLSPLMGWKEGRKEEALEGSHKWKTNNRFYFSLLSPALFYRLAGSLAPGLCWCVAQQQSEVIISLAVSIRFNFSSRLHLPKSGLCYCVLVESVQGCRILLPFQEEPGNPKGEKECAHMFGDGHTQRHIHMHKSLVPRCLY